MAICFTGLFRHSRDHKVGVVAPPAGKEKRSRQYFLGASSVLQSGNSRFLDQYKWISGGKCVLRIAGVNSVTEKSSSPTSCYGMPVIMRLIYLLNFRTRTPSLLLVQSSDHGQEA